ncbi:hypothetical protein JOQ06_011958, partial [Pogonophryne albipinna]
MKQFKIKLVTVKELRLCVEIIAKEGRSLKELYLVSCKITDHGYDIVNFFRSAVSTDVMG